MLVTYDLMVHGYLSEKHPFIILETNIIIFLNPILCENTAD